MPSTSADPVSASNGPRSDVRTPACNAARRRPTEAQGGSRASAWPSSVQRADSTIPADRPLDLGAKTSVNVASPDSFAPRVRAAVSVSCRS